MSATRSSVISWPEHYFFIIREPCLRICGGNQCAAALIHWAVRWHDTKLANEEEPVIKRSYAQIRSDLFMVYSRNQILSSIKLLEDIGILTRLSSSQDRTSKLALQVKTLQKYLENPELVIQQQSSNQDDESPNQIEKHLKNPELVIQQQSPNQDDESPNQDDKSPNQDDALIYQDCYSEILLKIHPLPLQEENARPLTKAIANIESLAPRGEMEFLISEQPANQFGFQIPETETEISIEEKQPPDGIVNQHGSSPAMLKEKKVPETAFSEEPIPVKNPENSNSARSIETGDEKSPPLPPPCPALQPPVINPCIPPQNGLSKTQRYESELRYAPQICGTFLTLAEAEVFKTAFIGHVSTWCEDGRAAGIVASWYKAAADPYSPKRETAIAKITEAIALWEANNRSGMEPPTPWLQNGEIHQPFRRWIEQNNSRPNAEAGKTWAETILSNRKLLAAKWSLWIEMERDRSQRESVLADRAIAEKAEYDRRTAEIESESETEKFAAIAQIRANMEQRKADKQRGNKDATA